METLNPQHYLVYVESVKQLKRDKSYQEAIELLIKLIDAVESEARAYKSHGTDLVFIFALGTMNS